MSEARTESVAVLGLGNMGAPIATNLVSAGWDPILWNRSAGRLAPFVEQGVRTAPTPAAAAREADILLTVLTDLPDVEQLLAGPDGALVGWAEREGSRPLLVVMGTVSAVALRELADRLAVHGIAVVDAPLSGGVAGAQQARLSIMVGGDAADVERVKPVFADIGSTITHLGGRGAGQLAKACNQIVVAATVASLAEAVVLARTAGIEAGPLLDVLA
ncbi:MAG: NAD(P)-dependent oxidoreductase, partial [Mycetocola sp.]